MLIDILFIGADGIDAEKGITSFNDGYAITSVMAGCVKQVIAVIDSTKIGRIGFNLVLPTSKIDILIIDRGITKVDKIAFEKKGVKVIIV